MSITAQCECGKTFKVKDEHAGKKGKCPDCGSIVLIPFPEEAPLDIDEVNWDAMNDLEAKGTPQASPGRLERQYAPAPPPPPMAPPMAVAMEGRATCPTCSQIISARALKCEFCGTAFHSGFARQKTLSYATPSGRGSDVDRGLTGMDWVLIIVCPGIGFIVGIVRVCMGRGATLLIASFIASAIYTGIKLAIAAATNSL